jgi:hypothetical protein
MFGELFILIAFLGSLAFWAFLAYLLVQALRAIQNIDRSLHDVARTLRNQNPMGRAEREA